MPTMLAPASQQRGNFFNARHPIHGVTQLMPLDHIMAVSSAASTFTAVRSTKFSALRSSFQILNGWNPEVEQKRSLVEPPGLAPPHLKALDNLVNSRGRITGERTNTPCAYSVEKCPAIYPKESIYPTEWKLLNGPSNESADLLPGVLNPVDLTSFGQLDPRLSESLEIAADSGQTIARFVDRTWTPLRSGVSSEPVPWIRLAEVSGPLGALRAALPSNDELRDAEKEGRSTNTVFDVCYGFGTCDPWDIRKDGKYIYNSEASTASSTPEVSPTVSPVFYPLPPAVPSSPTSDSIAGVVEAASRLRVNTSQASWELQQSGKKPHLIRLAPSGEVECAKMKNFHFRVTFDNLFFTSIQRSWMENSRRFKKQPPTKALKRRLERLGQQRGSLELDTLLGAFSRVRVPMMTYEQLIDFEKLLFIDNLTIFGVISGRHATPASLNSNQALPLLLTFVNTRHPNLYRTSLPVPTPV